MWQYVIIAGIFSLNDDMQFISLSRRDVGDCTCLFAFCEFPWQSHGVSLFCLQEDVTLFSWNKKKIFQISWQF